MGDSTRGEAPLAGAWGCPQGERDTRPYNFPKKRCRIHPAGGMGVSPNLHPYSPHEWGARGAEKAIFIVMTVGNMSP